MIDSCRPRKLEPGLAATYSKPSDLSTSSMKSEPPRRLSPMTCTSPGPLASPRAGRGGGARRRRRWRGDLGGFSRRSDDRGRAGQRAFLEKFAAFHAADCTWDAADVA